MNQHEFKRAEHSFYLGESEHDAKAYINWVPTGDKLIIIDHTVVSKELEGQGLGTKLVEQVAEMARAEGKKIRATCPFAKAVLEKGDKYSDVFEG